MAIWSSFSRAISKTNQLSGLFLGRVAPKNVVQVRLMSGHHRTLAVTPTRWQWHKTKDLMHMYIIVGAIPLGLISFCANMFIGPAELAPIPEGYVPQDWEYYRHPITRFFKKYIMESEQEGYERHLHHVWDTYDKAEFRKIEMEVKDLQAKRGDYKHWYYVPVYKEYHEINQQDMYEALRERNNGM